jgi:hypothetical protein
MRFLIVQPCWDHSEILASLLYFIKQSNHQVKIIYDWSHPEGNYLDYYIELFGFEENVKINYRSPKYHIQDVVKANKVIFVDEIHLKKFLSKGVYLEMIHKYYTINHLTKMIPYEIKVLSLGIVPFNRCINQNKTLINSFYNPKDENIKKNLNSGKIKYLIVGTPKFRRINFLEKLSEEVDNLNIEINYVVRQELDVKFKKYVNILTNVSTNNLIELIKDCDYIITLFNKNSVYHQDRISGIIPFAISFGKPVIMDIEFSELIKIPTDKRLIYNNSFLNFKKKIIESQNIDENDYTKMVEEIIKYRDIKITEQYLNFHLLFG